MKYKLAVISLVLSFLFNIAAISPMAAIPLPISDHLFDDYSIHAWDALNIEELQEDETTTYTVVEGDNLYRIALKYGVSLNSLMAWNGVTNTLIFPGDQLTIYNDGDEPATTYEEKS